MSIVISSSSFAGDGGATTSPAAAPTPLRYHLTVGQELVYRMTETRLSMSNPTQPAYTSVMSDTLRVVGANADGGWHLIECSQEIPGSQGAATGRPPRIGEFDLAPDGQVNIDPDTAMAIRPGSDFPLLPQDGTAKSWRKKLKQDDETVLYTAAPTTEPSVLNIDVQTENLFTRLYQWTETAQLRIDTGRGLLVHSSEHVDEPLYHAAENVTSDLTGDQIRPADWMAQYAQQVGALLAATKQYEKMMGDAESAGDTTPATTDKALAVLNIAKARVTQSELSPILDAAIANHARYVKEIGDDAKDSAEIIGKPAPAWDLADLAGTRHALADLRGKVVVLDFWYRGCGWCMRAMPGMKQLADQYRDKPVAIFGMNTDRDAKDAQFVVDFFKLPYPTLRTTMAQYVDPSAAPTTSTSQPLVPAAAYHVQGYPTLFIIGPDGILRKRFVGYSPTLDVDMGKEIDALLAGHERERRHHRLIPVSPRSGRAAGALFAAAGQECPCGATATRGFVGFSTRL
jgi:thiol-disulfide isomerase/thioredoxin